MKILLDENLPVKLKADFKGHEVITVREMKWHGKRNGELLGMATLNGFQVFITMDKQLQYQQNLKRFSILVVVLRAKDNQLHTLKPYVEKAMQALSIAPKTGVVDIDLISPT